MNSTNYLKKLSYSLERMNKIHPVTVREKKMIKMVNINSP
jgi:hypothetical protein